MNVLNDIDGRLFFVMNAVRKLRFFLEHSQKSVHGIGRREGRNPQNGLLRLTAERFDEPVFFMN